MQPSRKKENQIIKFESIEDIFNAFSNDSQNGLLLADRDNKNFCFANSQICRMLGYTQEEILKIKVFDIHPEKDLDKVMNQFERQYRGEFQLAKSTPVKRKDGSIFNAEIDTRVVELKGKKFLLGIFKEITN